MDLDLTPSTRSHGAQRMITATVLVCEALVVFFALGAVLLRRVDVERGSARARAAG